MKIQIALDIGEKEYRIPQVAHKKGATKQTPRINNRAIFHRDWFTKVDEAELNRTRVLADRPEQSTRVIPNIPNEFDEFRKRVLTG